MNARQQLGAGLLAATLGTLPVVFFLLVVRSVVLACAAVVVEVGLFGASRIALRRPREAGGRSTLHAAHALIQHY